MLNTIKAHFPENRKKWKTYLKVFLPIVLGSTFFALNGVVDNFMVGHINQGGSGLGAINYWTGILVGFFLGTAAAGSIVMAQFYHAKKYKIVKEVARLRTLLCSTVAIGFAIFAWVNPEAMAKVFLKEGDDHSAYVLALHNSVTYAKAIAFQWLLISVSFNIGNQFREIGFGKIAMFWGIGALIANVSLNAILMYGFNMGVAGAAWASVAGRIVSLSAGIGYILYKKLPIGFKPWTIFQISPYVLRLIAQRWFLFLSVFTVQFFVIFRNYFYGRGYIVGSIGTGVGAISVFALTGALMNVFTTTFNAISSMSANFVASELGKNNIAQAKINSNELKGFNTSVAALYSIALLLFAIAVPHMSFLSETKYDSSGAMTFDGHTNLLNVRNTLWVIACYYPMWIWFSTSYRNGSSGGKGKSFAFTDWFVSGPLQLGWAAIIMLVLVPSSVYLQNHLEMAYALFFVSDVLKLIFVELIYYKREWAFSLTTEQVAQEKAKDSDIIEVIQPD